MSSGTIAQQNKDSIFPRALGTAANRCSRAKMINAAGNTAPKPIELTTLDETNPIQDELTRNVEFTRN
jgi:hypothetical protein